MATMTINCHYCDYSCESFEKLAKHVISSGNSHRKGLKWANTYLLKVNILNQKQDKPEHIALTEEEHEAKENCQRELSGELSNSLIICPSCKTHNRTMLPTEHANNPYAWKNENGEYYVNCPNCKKNKPLK